MVCVPASLNDLKSLLNLWSSEWFTTGEVFCENESFRKGTRVLFDVSPWFLSFSKAHTHISLLSSFLNTFGSLTFWLLSSTALVVVFSLSSSLYASIPFSLDYSFMPASVSLPVFPLYFLSMNINASFDCQHLPFQIQLLA